MFNAAWCMLDVVRLRKLKETKRRLAVCFLIETLAVKLIEIVFMPAWRIRQLRRQFFHAAGLTSYFEPTPSWRLNMLQCGVNACLATLKLACTHACRLWGVCTHAWYGYVIWVVKYFDALHWRTNSTNVLKCPTLTQRYAMRDRSRLLKFPNCRISPTTF